MDTNTQSPAQPVQPVQTQPVNVPPQTKSSNKLLMVIGILSLLLLTLGGGYYVSQVQTTKPTPTLTPITTVSPSPIPTIDPTANWKIYSNQLYGFSFKYPSEWAYENEKTSYAKENSEEIFLVFGIPTASGKTTVSKSIDTELTLQVFKANPNDASLQVFLNNFGFSICPELNSEKGKPYVMDGKPGYFFEKTTCVPEIMMSYLFVTNGVDMYKISIRNPALTQLIFSTFKFTDQSQTTDISNWKTYLTNQYSFKYPQDWYVKTAKENFGSNYDDTEVLFANKLDKNGKIPSGVSVDRSTASGLINIGSCDYASGCEIWTIEDKFYDIKNSKRWQGGGGLYPSKRNVSLSKLGGKKAVLIESQANTDAEVYKGAYSTQYNVYLGNEYLTLTFGYDIRNPDNKEVLNTFNRLISSFKFTQ